MIFLLCLAGVFASLVVALISNHLVLRALGIKLVFDSLAVALLAHEGSSRDIRLMAALLFFCGVVVALSNLMISYERAKRSGRGLAR